VLQGTAAFPGDVGLHETPGSLGQLRCVPASPRDREGRHLRDLDVQGGTNDLEQHDLQVQPAHRGFLHRCLPSESCPRSERPRLTLCAWQFSALVLYMLTNTLGLDYVSVFVFCVLLLACDFWTVKNISGRLLVGLQWGTKLREDGATEWYFLTHPVSSRRACCCSHAELLRVAAPALSCCFAGEGGERSSCG
jgi:hypothetical protein